MSRGLILFGHGARDPRWADPIRRVQQRLVAALPEVRVEAAFLEFIQPDLPAAAARMTAGGCDALVIIPVFLGQGGHVREDLASLVQTLRDRHPGVTITCADAVGEDDEVLDAVAAYCIKSISAPPADAPPSIR